MTSSNSQFDNLTFEDDPGPRILNGPNATQGPPTVNGRAVQRSTGTRQTSDEEYLREQERERIALSAGKSNLRRTHAAADKAVAEAGLGPGQGHADPRPVLPAGKTRAEEKWVPAQTDFKSIDSPAGRIEDRPEWSDSMIRAPQPNQVRLDGLVSSGFPYGGRNWMMIRPLEWDEVEIIAQGSEQDSVQLTMRAVDRCIDIPVEMLTIPDFYQVLYWLRVQSYPDLPFTMGWECDEPVPGQGPEVYCGYENTSPLGHTNLVATELVELGFEDGMMDPRLDWPRTYLLPEIHALQRRSAYESALEVAEIALRDATLSPEQRRQANTEYVLLQNRKRKSENYLQKVCNTPDILTPELTQVLRWVKAGTTFAQKRDYMRSTGNLDLHQKALHMERNFDFGIHESVNVNCGKCGASRGFRLVVDVTSFLS